MGLVEVWEAEGCFCSILALEFDFRSSGAMGVLYSINCCVA